MAEINRVSSSHVSKCHLVLQINGSVTSFVHIEALAGVTTCCIKVVCIMEYNQTVKTALWGTRNAT